MKGFHLLFDCEFDYPAVVHYIINQSHVVASSWVHDNFQLITEFRRIQRAIELLLTFNMKALFGERAPLYEIS